MWRGPRSPWLTRSSTRPSMRMLLLRRQSLPPSSLSPSTWMPRTTRRCQSDQMTRGPILVQRKRRAERCQRPRSPSSSNLTWSRINQSSQLSRSPTMTNLARRNRRGKMRRNERIPPGRGTDPRTRRRTRRRGMRGLGQRRRTRRRRGPSLILSRRSPYRRMSQGPRNTSRQETSTCSSTS